MARRWLSRCAAWLAAVCLVLAVALGWVAWRRTTLLYGEDGNHFDGLVNLHAQGALAWAVLAVGALLLALGLYALHRQTRRRR
jgi:hypothetical protein